MQDLAAKVEMSMSHRIIPIVKPKNNLKKLKVKAMPDFDWLNSKYSSVFDCLVKLNEIIKITSKHKQ